MKLAEADVIANGSTPSSTASDVHISVGVFQQLHFNLKNLGLGRGFVVLRLPERLDQLAGSHAPTTGSFPHRERGAIGCAAHSRLR